jgi:pSer/pThr/pTyr-binding forkhead associated (FHA) protein
VSYKDNDQTSREGTGDTTCRFRIDFLGELDASAVGAAEARVGEVEGLPSGSALRVVKRGPNAGSRFLLDQSVTSAGRHPNSDIFLDDLTVSRWHAEFRRENNEFRIIDINGLNGTYVRGSDALPPGHSAPIPPATVAPGRVKLAAASSRKVDISWRQTLFDTQYRLGPGLRQPLL